MTTAIIIILTITTLTTALWIIISKETSPVNDGSNAPSIGGMLKSDSVNYKSPESNGMEKNPILKIMQLNWKMISKSDNIKHSKQIPPNVNEHNNIPYINDGNKYHMLDVYTPLNNSKNCPVIIDIHGGGWMYGDKELNKNYCLSLAARGYVVFNISYRLAPDVTVPQQLQDVGYALKWIGENLLNYTSDSENILLTGDSAGGQLAAYSAILCQSEELRKIFNVTENRINPSALLLTSPVAFMKNGIMSIYTKILWGKNYKYKNTYNFMNLDEVIKFAKLPPTYLITSSGDSLARNQTKKAAKLLENNGTEVILRDYPLYNGKSLPHVFNVIEPFDEIGISSIDDAIKFFSEHFSTKSEIKS